MAQFILAALALITGIPLLLRYIADRHNYRRGATSTQPSLWQLVLATGLICIGIALIFFPLAH